MNKVHSGDIEKGADHQPYVEIYCIILKNALNYH
jgi:hypothetical protein